MSKISDLEKGENVDFDHSTDQIIDDLLKVSKVSIFLRRPKLKIFWLTLHTLLIFPQQMRAFKTRIIS